MVESELASKTSEVNGVDVNNSDVKRLIDVKCLISERNSSVEILIETGSTYNVKSKAMCKRLGAILQSCSQVLCGFNGMKSVALGTVNVSCRIGKWQCLLDFMAVDHPSTTILGYNELKHHK